MRSRKLKRLESHFDWSCDLVVSDPASKAGRWAAQYLPGARAVRLDLGCGKGSFTARTAKAEPDVLFVGMDCESACVAAAAQRAERAGITNAVFAVGDARDLLRFFAPGELDMVYVNFCTPFTRASQAYRRLIYVDLLLKYRAVLRQGGMVRFKTDSAPLFDFSLTQFDLAGYTVLWSTEDLHAEHPQEIQSNYEERLTSKGARIHALCAVADQCPKASRQSAPQGLASYLPEDLDTLDYIPYGMEETVRNLKMQRAHAESAMAHEECGSPSAGDVSTVF